MQISIRMGNKHVDAELPQKMAEKIYSECASKIFMAHNMAQKSAEHQGKAMAAGAGEQQDARKSYKGFLLLRCPRCGEVKAFCTKKEMKGYHCFVCGEDMPFLEPLRTAWVRCKCGMHYSYKTNLDNDYIEANCVNCGAPVTMKWNERRKTYETMGD